MRTFILGHELIHGHQNNSGFLPFCDIDYSFSWKDLNLDNLDSQMKLIREICVSEGHAVYQNAVLFRKNKEEFSSINEISLNHIKKLRGIFDNKEKRNYFLGKMEMVESLTEYQLSKGINVTYVGYLFDPFMQQAIGYQYVFNKVKNGKHPDECLFDVPERIIDFFR